MVNVTEAAVKAITQIGHARAPHEACGLLVAVPSQYEPIVIEIPNGSKTPETSYEFTTKEARAIVHDTMDEQARAFSSAGVEQGSPFDDVVVWHTHPSHTAGPSEADLQHRDPRIKYLVLFLPTETAYRY